MNKWIGSGRLTGEPTTNQSTGGSLVARYTLAVDGYGKDAESDFISCVAFGKSAEFVQQYLHKGMKMIVEGRIKTGKYTNKEGKTVYTTDVIVEKHDFCESRKTVEETQEWLPTDDAMLPFV